MGQFSPGVNTGIPANPSQPFNDLANQQAYKWLTAGEKKGDYTINFIGEQKLEEWRKAS